MGRNKDKKTNTNAIKKLYYASPNQYNTRSIKILKLPLTRSNIKKHPKYLSLTPELSLSDTHQTENARSKKHSPITLLVGRKTTHKYALSTDSSIETQKLKARMSHYNPATTLRGHAEITACTPAADGRKRARGLSGTPYEETLKFNHKKGTKGVLYISRSPENIRNSYIELKKSLDINIRSKFLKTKGRKSSFLFKVTPDGIIERKNKKRPCNQKQLTEGYSAADIFRALGVKFDKKISRFFHLAHRIGWGLGGPQVKENIDPATAGSNYTTLFYVEETIRFLLNEEKVPYVKMKGKIQYHKTHKTIPEVITYTWSWINSNLEQKSMSKSIYPLSKRQPTVEECFQVRCLASAINAINATPNIKPAAQTDTIDSNPLLTYANSSLGSPLLDEDEKRKIVNPTMKKQTTSDIENTSHLVAYANTCPNSPILDADDNYQTTAPTIKKQPPPEVENTSHLLAYANTGPNSPILDVDAKYQTTAPTIKKQTPPDIENTSHLLTYANTGPNSPIASPTKKRKVAHSYTFFGDAKNKPLSENCKPQDRNIIDRKNF